MQREELGHRVGMDVSRETFVRLERYVSLLRQWQGSVNLIGPGTEAMIWERHIADSLFLLPLLEKYGASEALDLGSGGGFPGMVCALAAPDRAWTLVDSDRKKCEFLKHVSRETSVKATVLCRRIEALQNVHSLWVTARALASVAQILDWTQAVRLPSSRLFLLKGRQVEKELDEAKRRWSFEVEVSRVESQEGVIIHLSHIRETGDGSSHHRGRQSERRGG